MKGMSKNERESECQRARKFGRDGKGRDNGRGCLKKNRFGSRVKE